MPTNDRQAHWQNVYLTKAESEISWFQEIPAISLEMIEAAGVGTDSAIIDVGGGSSRRVDTLVDRGSHASHQHHQGGLDQHVNQRLHYEPRAL